MRGRGRGVGRTCLVLWMFWLWKCYDHLACKFCKIEVLNFTGLSKSIESTL